MKTLVPMTSLPTFRKEWDRLFDRLWEGNGFDLAEMGAWTPFMDVSETKEALTVAIEIPGIDPKDVHVTVRNGVLTVTGEKKQQEEKKDERHYRMERSYGAFERSVRLPIPVDEAKVKAVFKNGVLTITLPKTVEAKGLSVPVQVG
jgi:HSP20 family protein